jgi:hypothetical protein
MIAQRFRALGWVAIVTSAATGLYLISLQVAAERGKLEAVERQIAAAQHDMRQLQTELGTRASMRQLERWNGEVLALSAPKASQFARDGAQLVALNFDDTGRAPNAPPPVMAMLTEKPAPAVAPAPARPVTTPTVQKANFVKPVRVEPPKLQRVAMLEPVSMRDVSRIAATESRKRP